MKPHSLRKTLWFTNVALALAVVAVAAWYVTDVRADVAKVADRKPSYRPPELEKLRKQYESERATGLKWQPKAPVSEEDITKYILRPEFEKTDPKHWIFSGPLPPEKMKTDGPKGPVEVKPKGLETQGKISSVYFAPPSGTVVLFAFTGGKVSRAFGIGDWVRQKHDDPERHRITSVKQLAPGVYEIGYAVFGGGKEKPELEGVVSFSVRGDSEQWPNWLRPVNPPKPKPTAGEGGAAEALEGGALASKDPDGAKPGESGADGEAGAATEAGGAEETGAVEVDEPEVFEVSTKPVDELTVEDLKPKIYVNEENRNERAIAVDPNTYRWLKGKNTRSIAQDVKTEVAKDKRTGQPIGLRITGLKTGSPAGAFQVKKGDVLVSINGRKVTSKDEAVRIVEGLNPDSIVTVVIDRHGKLITYKVDPRDPKTRRQVRYFENLK